MRLIYRSIVILIFFCLKALGQENALDSAAFSIDLEEYVITAQYEPTHYKEANHKVSIITQEQIKNIGAISIDQALLISPAIRIGYDPAIGSKTITMRGISSRNVAILIDGVPTIGRIGGSIDLSQINLQNVKRIEIVEGALSNIYGSNAAGGVINLITDKSQLDPWQIKLGVQLETIGEQNYDINVGHRIAKLTANVHARYYNYNQYPIDSLRVVEDVEIEDGQIIKQTKYAFNPKTQIGIGGYLRYDFADDHTVMFTYDYNDEDVTDYGVIKRTQYNPYANDKFVNTIRSDYTLNYKNKWDKIASDITSSIKQYSRINNEKRYYLETETFDSLVYDIDTTKFDLLFNRGIISYDWNKHFRAIGGISHSLERGSGDRIVNRTEADSTIGKFTEVAPFIDLSYKGINNLNITTTGRYTLHSHYDARFTPSFLIKYSLDDSWIFRLGYAQGYRSPSLKELYLEFIDINHNIIGNTNLTPEVSHDIQFTTDHDISTSLMLSLNAYYTKITDKIELVAIDDALKYSYENVDEDYVYGIQPKAQITIGNNLRVNTSASFGYWSTSFNSDDVPAVGSVFDMSNGVQYTISSADVNIMFNHRHVGKEPIYRRIDDEIKVGTISAYDLVDMSVNKSFLNKKLNVTLGVNNLFNAQSTNVSGLSSGAGHGTAGNSNPISRGISGFAKINVKLH